MQIKELLAILMSDKATTIAVLALIISVIATWFSLKGLKLSREQVVSAKESLKIQEQQYRFGRDLARDEFIIDGSIQLRFLNVDFTGPKKDEKAKFFEDLMLQSAIEALITVENNSLSDALVQDVGVIPKFLLGKSKQSWLAKILTRYALPPLSIGPFEGLIVIGLKEQSIRSMWGSTAMAWHKLLDSWSGYFRDKPAWNVSIHDISTGEPIKFDNSTVIPHDGRKRVWKLKFSLESEFYRELLTEYRTFFSGIKVTILTDIGNIQADFDFDKSKLFELLL